MEILALEPGTAPLLISLPHDGSHVPPTIAARLQPSARMVPDTDWLVSRLYGFARDLGASILQPFHSRYVVDLNRPPDGASLYPGQNTTGLCPLQQFSGEPVYLPGQEPSADEIAARVETYWRPYHDALQAELERLHGLFGQVVLWEAHSIRSELPFLFEGRLPDLNLGTADGTSCSPHLQEVLEAELDEVEGYTHVVNGRFKGGYITRAYGNPMGGVDAVQLELAQSTYMDESSSAWVPERARRLQDEVLRDLLGAALDLILY